MRQDVMAMSLPVPAIAVHHAKLIFFEKRFGIAIALTDAMQCKDTLHCVLFYLCSSSRACSASCTVRGMASSPLS